jgi:hypothetical protein
MSSEDIDKGQRWGAELAELLATTSQGLVCVTAENLHEPWLNFEAGALAKSVAVSRVRPVLLDLTPADVTGPLAQFQATSLADKADMFKLVASLNAGTDKPIGQELLTKSFERAWQELQDEITTLAQVPAGGQVKLVRRPEEKIDEILNLLRDLERRPPSTTASTRAESGDLVIDLSEIDPTLGAAVFSVRDFTTVSSFLNEVYFQIGDFVPPYTYGVKWELYDVRGLVALRKLRSSWASGKSRRHDARSLPEVGLRPGLILAARLAGNDSDR